MNTLKVVALAAAALALAGSARGAANNGFSLDVVLDGGVRPEYRARGSVYVEAVRGREYVLRITNPLPVRVAVALAVDGLNTLDAGRSSARTAPKWVLGPYESLEVPGWQVNGSDARRFVFTGERSSYGAWLGSTENLGVIEAVFFRERPRPVRASPQPVAPRTLDSSPGRPLPPPAGAPAPGSEEMIGGVAGGVESAQGAGVAEKSASAGKGLSDEYAATGIGERTRHDVEWIDFDLEKRPAAAIRIRYEFREQLVRLGVLPTAPDPLTRREGARGFPGRYCPEPPGVR
jgi:hypothetical protein